MPLFDRVVTLQASARLYFNLSDCTRNIWYLICIFRFVCVLQAYEHLCNLELLLPADGVTQRVQREYQLVCLQVDRVHVLGALQRYPSCPTDIKHWAQSSMS